jgi:RimJ/RimL family protein N-acetyltransferase
VSPTLHTARLVLTPVGDHDLAPLHAHWNDPQVARWLWDASPVPLQTVADLIAHSNGTFRTAARGLWAIRPATAVLAYAFDVLTLPEVLATTDDANKASIHLLTRLGATPTPRVQIGPHTYPSFRIRPPHRPGPAPSRPL